MSVYYYVVDDKRKVYSFMFKIGPGGISGYEEGEARRAMNMLNDSEDKSLRFVAENSVPMDYRDIEGYEEETP